MFRILKVLIVEDEFLTARSLKLDLEDLGMNVLEPVAKGEEAVVIALEQSPDLILMDIRLAGGLDGIETAEQIVLKKRIPIVFMTGYSTEFIRMRAKKLHPLGYLQKPIDNHQIKTILDISDTSTMN